MYVNSKYDKVYEYRSSTCNNHKKCTVHTLLEPHEMTLNGVKINIHNHNTISEDIELDSLQHPLVRPSYSAIPCP